jgi:hypothetical protein
MVLLPGRAKNSFHENAKIGPGDEGVLFLMATGRFFHRYIAAGVLR